MSNPQNDPQVEPRSRKRIAFLLGGLVLVVLLGAAVAIIVSAQVRQQVAAEHQALIVEYQQVVEELNQNLTILDASETVSGLLPEYILYRTEAGRAAAAELTKLGTAPAPVFTAASAAALSEAAKVLSDALLTAGENDPEKTSRLQEAHEAALAELATAEQSLKEATRALEGVGQTDPNYSELTEQKRDAELEVDLVKMVALPALDLTPSEVVGLLELTERPDHITPVPDSEVTPAVLEAAISARDEARDRSKSISAEAQPLHGQVEELEKVIGEVREALVDAATEAPAQAKVVADASPLATPTMVEALTEAASAADAAVDAAGKGAGALLEQVVSYASAAAAVIASQKAEAAVAETAAVVEAGSAEYFEHGGEDWSGYSSPSYSGDTGASADGGGDWTPPATGGTGGGPVAPAPAPETINPPPAPPPAAEPFECPGPPGPGYWLNTNGSWWTNGSGVRCYYWVPFANEDDPW